MTSVEVRYPDCFRKKKSLETWNGICRNVVSSWKKRKAGLGRGKADGR